MPTRARPIRRPSQARGTPTTPLQHHTAPVVRAADRIDHLIRRQVVPPEGPRTNPPPQSAWLLAIGRGLKLQYDEALSAPMPWRLAVLVAQVEAKDVRDNG